MLHHRECRFLMPVLRRVCGSGSLIVALVVALPAATQPAHAAGEAARSAPNAAPRYARAALPFEEDALRELASTRGRVLNAVAKSEAEPHEDHCVHLSDELVAEALAVLKQACPDPKGVLDQLRAASEIESCDFYFSVTTPQPLIIASLQPLHDGPLAAVAIDGLLAAVEGCRDRAMDAAIVLLGVADHLAQQPQPLSTATAMMTSGSALRILQHVQCWSIIPADQREAVADGLRTLYDQPDGDILYVKAKLQREGAELARWVLANPRALPQLFEYLMFMSGDADTPARREFLNDERNQRALKRTPAEQAESIREAYAATVEAWGDPAKIYELDLVLDLRIGARFAILYFELPHFFAEMAIEDQDDARALLDEMGMKE